ncbi:hypothetical protein ACWEOE_19845 [Amycolatopsis sp. NPDC004368]
MAATRTGSGEPAGASTPAATSGGGRANPSGTPGGMALSARERRALQELLDAADAVTWGVSMKMSGVVWGLRETTAHAVVPTVVELELLLERASRLHDALARCRAFVADHAGCG